MTTNSAITPESTALLERVQQIKKQYRLTFSQIAKQAGMHQPTVTNQINGKYNIDVRVLLAIAVLCPDLSCDWLLRGEGDIKNETALTDEKQLEKLVEPIYGDIKSLFRSQQAIEQAVNKIINLIDK